MSQLTSQNKERLKKHRTAARLWVARHPKENKERCKQWRVANPDKVELNRQEQARKGGKYYNQHVRYMATGIPGEKAAIRNKYQFRYRKYKQIIDPEGLTALHHEWIPRTSEWSGLALVEKYQHQHGFINVIQILEGKIMLPTEEEVRGYNNGI